MDTRYWGPSGWRLLHLISFSEKKDTTALRDFFNVLPYILPCKYCRQSLSEYMSKDPVPKQITPGTLSRWLWRIHNKVNGKLRKQRLSMAADPPYEKVKELYMERLEQGCTRTNFEGWEFLFSIAEAHPFSLVGRNSVPFDGAPAASDASDLSDEEKNRWNILRPEERYPYFLRFWELLPEVLPFPEWRSFFLQGLLVKKVDWSSRKDAIKGLWGLRCFMEENLELLNQTDYSSLCRELKTHRSGCSSARRGKTCRRKRSGSK